MSQNTWCILDFENQNHNWYGSLASPHHPDNYVVATGWALDGGIVKAEYYKDKQGWLNSHAFEQDLLNSKNLVAHNLTFELHWLLKTKPDTLFQYIREGGKFWCTQYAEYILSHQTDLYPKLEDTAVRYGGYNKVDEVKMLWESGVLTADIDEALLMRYLAADGKNEWSRVGEVFEGDVANTRRVCFAQVALLKQQGMLQMFRERMDSLVFNAIATFYGLHVDMDVATKNMQEQYKQIDEIKSSILKLLPDDLPADFEFSFTSDYHRSALLFGGALKYKAKVSYDPIKYEQVEAYQYKWGSYVTVDTFEGACPEDQSTMLEDLVVYKAGKRKGEPKVFKIDTDLEKLKWGEKVYKFKGLIDFDKLPKVVAEAYIGKRAEFKGKRELDDGTPIYSTGKDSLDVLATHTDVAKPLKELAALIKDTTTYYLVEDGNKKSGMLQFVEPDGIIHHQLNNCATVTGRLSGSKPNMQNIPRDGTSRVKEMFNSRFDHWLLVGEGIKNKKIRLVTDIFSKVPLFYNVLNVKGRIVEVDYSALEVVTLASISGDKNLMRMLVEGIDMHCYRLAAKLNESYESVFEKCHNKEHPEHKAYKQMRTDIKPRAFA